MLLYSKPFYLSSNIRRRINHYDPLLVFSALCEKYSYKIPLDNNHKKAFQKFIEQWIKEASQESLDKIYNLLVPDAQYIIRNYNKDKRTAFRLLLEGNKSNEIKKYLVYLYMNNIL